ncbi:hypothetical protein NDU88_003826 [Pleurodeles waltl]|uniref:Uncharacterized protein n=1 Tax=Pleurodeles waltl TaxID=8319 RepID=A0AAV7LI46_PLEWA|nr:hypothetical protein NDU88_003826 [Pleurodeles waltl]
MAAYYCVVFWGLVETMAPPGERGRTQGWELGCGRVCGALEFKTDFVRTEVLLMMTDFNNLGTRVKEVEDSLKEVKDDSAILKEQVCELKATTAILEAKAEVLE